MEGILDSIKKMLGIEADDLAFDQDIIMSINAVFMTLSQIGVGPAEGYSITGSTETWSQFIGSAPNFEAAKAYVYLRVRVLFDPPTSSFVLESMNRQASELEWRLNVQSENYIPPVV